MVIARESEKEDKRIHNRRFRRICRLLTRLSPDKLFYKVREISDNWDFDKDNKHIWSWHNHSSKYWVTEYNNDDEEEKEGIKQYFRK